MPRVFYSTDFEGFWPVGTAAIVVADSEEEARRFLNNAIQSAGLKNLDYTLEEFVGYGAKVLNDGNY